MLKRHKLILLLICTLSGAQYFTTFSQLDLNPSVQGFLALLPIQLGVLIYFYATGRLTAQKKLPKRN